MNRAILLAALLPIATPAFALQDPSGTKNADPRVCDVVYNANDITDVVAAAGDTITIKFGPTEHIQAVSPSDTAHLKYTLIEGSNILWLKATQAMPPQPIPIRTIRDDGQPPRDYVLQWTALPDQAASSVNVAAAGDVTASEIPTTPKSRCYTIRYQYPADEKAAKVAAWKAAQDKSKRQAQEIALHQQAQVAPRNVNYVAQGDAALAPTSIFDDGYTTQIEFAGNRRIPVLLTVTPDGKESQISGFTTEDNGIIKIHEVLPLIRLRDGDTVLCIVNRAYNPTGNNPGTGTTSPDMNRDVGAHR